MDNYTPMTKEEFEFEMSIIEKSINLGLNDTVLVNKHFILYYMKVHTYISENKIVEKMQLQDKNRVYNDIIKLDELLKEVFSASESIRVLEETLNNWEKSAFEMPYEVSFETRKALSGAYITLENSMAEIDKIIE